MIRYEWECVKCGHQVSIYRKMNDCRDEPKPIDEAWDSLPTDCYHEWMKSLVAPSVLRASYLEGQRTSSPNKGHQEFSRLKKAVELEVDLVSARPGSTERRDISNEIKSLRGNKK